MTPMWHFTRYTTLFTRDSKPIWYHRYSQSVFNRYSTVFKNGYRRSSEIKCRLSRHGHHGGRAAPCIEGRVEKTSKRRERRRVSLTRVSWGENDTPPYRALSPSAKNPRQSSRHCHCVLILFSLFMGHFFSHAQRYPAQSQTQTHTRIHTRTQHTRRNIPQHTDT